MTTMLEDKENGSTTKVSVPEEVPSIVSDKPHRCPATHTFKLMVFGMVLLNITLVILTTVMMHYVLLTTSTSATTSQGNGDDGVHSTSARKAPLANGTEVPLGAIIAWIPSPNPLWQPEVPLPKGWQICNGSIIIDDTSPWVGQFTPNLTNRFLRGGDFTNFMTYQEDQIQDHVHVDWGHGHTDQGHSHNDTGHTHVDTGHTHSDNGHTHTDQGHTHTDSGHGHTDAGHTHAYYDEQRISGNDVGSSDNYDFIDGAETTDTGYANIQTGYAVISESYATMTTDSADITTNQANIAQSSAAISTDHAILNNATSNLDGVEPGVRDARVGTETRPKAAHILWIMKVSEHL